MTRQAALSTLTDKLNRLWELLEQHPESPKTAARDKRFLELLTEYERISDGHDPPRE
jgi:hypothetical protein